MIAEATAVRPPSCDDAVLWDLWLSRLHLPAVAVADELRLFPLLAREAATAETVAAGLGLTPRGAESLLGVLAGLGLLAKSAGRFALTAAAREYLLPDSPYYWGGVLAAFRATPDRHSPEKLLRGLREEAGRRVSGDWANGIVPAGQARLITEYMHAHSFPSAAGLAQHVPLDGVRSLLDAGAASGCFSIALALRHPGMRFTLLDLPPVCEVAESIVRGFGLEDRIATHPANFFRDAWPRGHDAVLLSNVLHDWDAGQCRFLLGRTFESLDPGGCVLVHEMLLDDDRLGLAPSTMALQMAVGTAGTQFTRAELAALLTSAGFAGVRFIQTFAYFSTAVAWRP
jgi:3-hydroxy-5-methyl-1-naphthoate 3-O-methyltransferase